VRRSSTLKPRRCKAVLSGLVCTLLLSMGCGLSDGRVVKDYKFNPVKGRVFTGDQPMTQGTVEFQPVSDPNFTSAGPIQPDGSFTLTTIMPGKTNSGAPEGEYRVMISVPQPPGQRPVGPFRIPEKITVNPGENDFKLRIPPVKLP
jgi:hypothetical protein